MAQRKGTTRRAVTADKRTPRAAAPKGAAAKPAARRPARRRSRGGSGGGRRTGPWPVRLLRRLLRALWGVGWRLGVLAVLILGGFVAFFAAQLPPAPELVDGRVRGSVTMLDRDGEVFAWRGDQFGGAVRPADAPLIRDAVVATEDRRFYSHFGVSPRGIASAIRINLSEGRGALSGHGGSTITQQTAKLLCLGVPYDPDAWESEAAYEADCRRTTIARKAKEAVYAMAMELRYTKDEILTIYLNRAFLGAGARGVEAAAQRYFGKSARDLEVQEAALIAGLLVAPSRYAPTRDLALSNRRAATVIRLMEEQGYISTAEADIAIAQPAKLSAAAQQPTGGYFADWVMASGPEFYTRDTGDDVTIRTTFDPAIQRAAEEAVTEVFATKVKPGSEAEAAVVVMSSDGAVRAMVGGRDLDATGAFNRATMARRQPGSAYKPFVYAAALDLGHSPLATVVDEPISIRVPGSGTYEPRNFDRRFHGRVTLADALRDSLNVPAVKVAEEVGREAVGQVATDFGLRSDPAQGPAMALGVAEATLIDMTGAYAGILNGGRSVRPYGLVDLSTAADGAVMTQEGGIGERVISEDAARQLVWMMTHVIESGTGRRAALPNGWQAAGKTGTTQEGRDAWFVGFTADYAVGVWMGYDDNRPLSGVTGGGLPADIWRETVMRISAARPPGPLPMMAPVGLPAPQPQEQPLPTAQREYVPDTPRQVPPEDDRLVERVLIDVLRDLLGGN